MIEINLKNLEKDAAYQKNVLYKIQDSRNICFEEIHKNSKEIVNLKFVIDESQYGIFANEYRSPNVCKQSCKVADVLACIVDTDKKVIYTTIFDVKRNISAFSDDLSKDQAMLTAIKEVRDFVKQIHDELLHKNSFMLFYYDEEYEELEKVGIVTRSFESEKFLAVAELLEKLFQEQEVAIPVLIKLKLMTSLKPYFNQIETLKKFADKKIKIGKQIYDLHVFLLHKVTEAEYVADVNVVCES